MLYLIVMLVIRLEGRVYLSSCISNPSQLNYFCTFRYWPEFASLAPAISLAGKASLTVAEALSHRGGLTCAGGE
jgi:hypothetical protein